MEKEHFGGGNSKNDNYGRSGWDSLGEGNSATNRDMSFDERNKVEAIEYEYEHNKARGLESEARRLRGERDQTKTERRKRAKALIGGVIATAIIATGYFGVEHVNDLMDAKSFRNAQGPNIKNSRIFEENNINEEKMKFTGDSMEFTIGDTTYKLEVETEYLDGEPSNLDGGICGGESVTECENGDVIENKFSVKNKDGGKSRTGISIDSALERLGYGDSMQ